MNFSKTGLISFFLNKNKGIENIFHDHHLQPFIEVRAEFLKSLLSELNTNSNYFFDFLNSITGLDNGPDKGSFDLIYHLSSIPLEHSIAIKVSIDRSVEKEAEIETISDIYKSAEWHEREIYDFFGIKFKNHPDLRRILLPADWEGHPMRKDYDEQSHYHGIKVKY